MLTTRAGSSSLGERGDPPSSLTTGSTGDPRGECLGEVTAYETIDKSLKLNLLLPLDKASCLTQHLERQVILNGHFDDKRQTNVSEYEHHSIQRFCKNLKCAYSGKEGVKLHMPGGDGYSTISAAVDLHSKSNFFYV